MSVSTVLVLCVIEMIEITSGKDKNNGLASWSVLGREKVSVLVVRVFFLGPELTS